MAVSEGLQHPVSQLMAKPFSIKVSRIWVPQHHLAFWFLFHGSTRNRRFSADLYMLVATHEKQTLEKQCLSA